MKFIKYILLVLLIIASVEKPCFAQKVKIIFAGDLMGHSGQTKAALMADSTYNYKPCFNYIKNYVKNADIAVLNLEVTLAGPPYQGYPHFSSPDALAKAAQQAGFNIMTTANNHCLDRDKQGLERTIKALDSIGLLHLGTYIDKESRDKDYPLFVKRKGIKIAFLNYTYGTNGILPQEPNIVNYINREQIALDLKKAKENKADFIITMIHWGIEYATHSNQSQEELAQFILENGSNVVIGGHSHTVQNLTLDCITDNDRYPEIVVYSMGNLISNQRKINTDGGIMIELDISRKKKKTRTVACHYMPYWVHRGTVDGLYQYYIVPSSDAVKFPKKYQIEGKDYDALKLFHDNTRARIDSCALENGENILETDYFD